MYQMNYVLFKCNAIQIDQKQLKNANQGVRTDKLWPNALSKIKYLNFYPFMIKVFERNHCVHYNNLHFKAVPKPTYTILYCTKT